MGISPSLGGYFPVKNFSKSSIVVVLLLDLNKATADGKQYKSNSTFNS